MKAVFLTSSLSSGGAERIACILANSWSSRGDKVTLIPTFSGHGECFYTLSSNIHLVYLADLVSSSSRSIVNQLARLLALRRFIDEDRPDIIVSFLSNVNVAAIIASAGLKIPVIICERTDPFIMPTSILLRAACRMTYPFADALVVQTEAVANKYRSANYPLRHIQVIPNPVTNQLLDIERQNGSGNEFCFIAVGRLDEGKQFNLLIRVFSKLAKQYGAWNLRIFGDGPLRSALQKQIIDCGLESRITLMGITTNVGSELAQADAFVMTSRYEGFPNVLLEAMAVGLPCVTFDCPSGPREMTLDGEIALLVPLNDEIALEKTMELIITDNSLRLSLGIKARESVSNRYELNNVLKKWDELFSRIGTI